MRDLWPLSLSIIMWVWARVRRSRESRRNRNAGLDWECRILQHLEELHLTSSRSDQPCMHKTHPPKCPSTNTMTLILMGCPLDVKPSTHSPCYPQLLHVVYDWWLSTHTHVSSLPLLYGEILKCKRLAAGKWTQKQGSALLCQALSCQILYQLSQAGARRAGTRAQRVFSSS